MNSSPPSKITGYCTGRNVEVFLISRFSWVADDTKIIHVEGGIILPAKFSK